MSNDTERVTCVNDECGTFPMDSALVEKLKRSGNTFTCPAGHEQYFTESTEDRLRERVSELERESDRLMDRVKEYREEADEWFDRWRSEKERRKRLESVLLRRVTGIVEVGPGEYKWSCACDSRGTKAFDDADACRDAWEEHRRREGCGESVPEDVIEA